jgi:WD40 repeat protein/serine/threonine protein kinase
MVFALQFSTRRDVSLVRVGGVMMAAVALEDAFLMSLRKSNLLSADLIDNQLANLRPGADSAAIARRFVKAGLLTKFQVNCLTQGKWRNLIIANKYKIIDYVGDGGMGQVYLAEHLLMQRRVALKVPPPKKLAGPGMTQRFIREAQALAALDHPNIVRAHDLERFGKLYMLAMEYVDGPNFRDLVAENGPLPVGRAAHYVAQAAQGLQHANEAGWVHRDIKPANLLVDPAGVVKVLDLGLAFLLGEDAESPTRKFDENTVLGTADYLAPEQAIDSHEVDIRADIYSFGATMYFLLTGRAPFEGSTIAQKLMAHQMTEPAAVATLRPDVPQGMCRVLAKMMAKSPADRYQTPAEVAQALMPFTSDADLAPPPRAGRTATARRAGEPTLASTLHARSGSGKKTRKIGPRAVTWLNRLDRVVTWLNLLDTKAKAALGVASGIGLLLTGVLFAYLFSGHKSTAATPGAQLPPITTIQNSLMPAPIATPGERFVFQAHRGIAECVRLLPDGRFITAGDDRCVRLWDAYGQQLLRQFDGHTETVRTVTLFPTDSRLIVSAARDGTLRLWDLETGAEVRRFVGHVGQVWCGDVSPDGRLLLSCGADKSVRLWDARTGALVRKLLGHTDIATSVAFLPDGGRAVSCGTDKTVRLWDTQTGAELNSITLPDRAYRLTLAPDARRVVIGCRSAAHVWDLESDKVTVFDSSMDRGFYVEQARFSPDGRWLLAGGSDGIVRMWNVATGRELPPIKALAKGKVLEVIWAADGRSFAVSCGDGTVRVWNWSPSGGAQS